MCVTLIEQLMRNMYEMCAVLCFDGKTRRWPVAAAAVEALLPFVVDTCPCRCSHFVKMSPVAGALQRVVWRGSERRHGGR